MYSMAKLRIIRWLLPLFMFLFLGSGCVYFNTFFNAKKKFNEAEEIQKKNREGQQNVGGLNRPGGGRTGGRFQQTGGGRTGGSRSGQSPSQVTPQVRLLYEDAIKKASKENIVAIIGIMMLLNCQSNISIDGW